MNNIILNQLPGILGVMNPNRQIICVNEHCAEALGFKSINDAMGTLIDNVPCKASEFSDIFADQNNAVMTTGNKLKILDINQYANDEILTVYAEKSPLYDINNNFIATTYYGIELNHSTLAKVCNEIALSDIHYRKNRNTKQRSYQVGIEFKNTTLTPRELECLYFLVRGKTITAISVLLNLSKRTVEHYIDNIKVKLNCGSKAALIEYLIEHNFIDFIPDSILKNANVNISVVL